MIVVPSGPAIGPIGFRLWSRLPLLLIFINVVTNVDLSCWSAIGEAIVPADSVRHGEVYIR